MEISLLIFYEKRQSLICRECLGVGKLDIYNFGQKVTPCISNLTLFTVFVCLRSSFTYELFDQ